MSTFDAYAIGCSFCRSTAPIPLELASTDIFTGLAGSKYFRTGAWVTNCLSVSKLASWCSLQCHSTSFSRRVLSGAVDCDRLGMNLAR